MPRQKSPPRQLRCSGVILRSPKPAIIPRFMHRHDVLILGSGLAALPTALRLADQRRVAIVTKRQMIDGASDWAQGGIAAAIDNGDSVEAHVRDTLAAGAGPWREGGPA